MFVQPDGSWKLKLARLHTPQNVLQQTQGRPKNAKIDRVEWKPAQLIVGNSTLIKSSPEDNFSNAQSSSLVSLPPYVALQADH